MKKCYYFQYFLKYFFVLVCIIPILTSCNSGGNNNSSQESATSLNQYISQLTYTPFTTNLANDRKNLVLSVTNSTTLTSIQISFYQNTNCSSGLQKTLTLLPESRQNLASTFILLAPGFYTSNSNSNFMLCNLYSGVSGSGCEAEYQDINSVKFIYNYQESPGGSTLCLDASGGGDKLASYISLGNISAKQVLNSILTIRNLNNVSCTANTTCTYDRPYYSSIDRACAAGEIKCSDGECKTSRSLCTSQNECPASMIKCPNNSTHPECVSDVSLCTITVYCPDSVPVRCDNSTCAKSEAECPPPLDSWGSRFLCPDGSFSINTANCGTAEVCPSKAPFKCWDNTCRQRPDECPTRISCPTATPHLCSNGTCAVHLDDCAKVKACPQNLPVQCPDNTCAASVLNCVM